MESIYQIREFETEDYSSIIELWKITGMGGSERGDNLDVIRNTKNAKGILYVMINPGGKIIGSSWINQDGRRSYIHHFAIHPDYQGRGLSKKLLETSLDYCRKLGHQIKIEVHSQNQKALNLYKSYGFSELANYGVYIIRDINIKKP